MGLLIEGHWHDEWYDTESTRGRFVRWESTFRNWVTADGSSGFKAEPGRYHLYIGLICPWAHRTAIFRKLKGLEEAISVSIVEPAMGAEGWYFAGGPGTIPDSVNGATHLHEIYTAVEPDFSGRVTIPVLWDKKEGTIVNNESSEIIRMLNTEFDAFGNAELDLYPEDLRAAIDALNGVIYETVNNGVYRCGFATTQEAYEEAFEALFETLDDLETRLRQDRYLLGDRPTEADWRLFPTLVRFDLAYYGNFKCNKRRLVEYPNLWAYTRDLYQIPGIAETVDADHIKRGYYGNARTNPTGVVPKGPAIDFTAPHGRSEPAVP